MAPATAIGFLAGALTTLSFVPQVVRTFRTRRCNDLSWWMLLAFASGVALWLSYGIVMRSAPIIAANVATLALVLAIMGMKIAYRRPTRATESTAASSSASASD